MGDRSRCERNDSRPTEGLREPRQHRQVSVERDLRESPSAKRRQPVLVLESAELALHSGATPVEALPLVGAVWDAVERDRAGLAERDDGDAAALARLLHDAVGVVA